MVNNSQKNIELYVYVDGVNDVPFYGASYQEYILSNGEVYETPDGFTLNVRVASEQIKIGSFRYDAKRMGGAPTIAFTLMYDECLDKFWSDHVYAKFRGERYFLKQTPTSSKSNDDARYRHDVELVAERTILDNAYFYDAVIGEPIENDVPVTNSTKFNFYGHIEKFVERMNASLQYTGIQKVSEDGNVISGYHVVLDDDVVTRDQKQVSFDSAVFSQALQEAYNTFGIPFYFDGKVIHIGFSNNIIEDVLEYGVDGALISATKTNANFKVINRATGVGSTENIPYYYPNSGPKGQIELSANGSISVEDIKVVDEETFHNLSVNDVFTFRGDMSKNQLNVEVQVPSTSTNIDFVEGEARINKLYIEDKKNVGVDIKYNFFFDTDNDAEIELKWILENYPNAAIDMTPPLKTAWGKDHLEFKANKVILISNEDSQELSFEEITEKHTYYSNIIKKSGQTSSGYTANELRQTGIKFSCPNMHGHATVLVEGIFKTLGNFWDAVPDYFWGENSKKKPYGDIVFTTDINTYSTGGWKDQDGKSYNMKNYGVEFLREPEYGDSFSYSIIKYIKTSNNLQPLIYRATDGAERFYNAINYPFAFVDGYELKYGEYVLDGEVHNDAYKKDDGNYYRFTNEYKEGRPREHVFTVEDIKPTIKEMTNNISWVEKDEEGNDKTVFQRIDMFSEFAYNKGDNDETYIDPNGNTSFKHPYFFAKLRKLDFNLFEHASELGEMTFSMTSGNCGACNFKIGVSDDYPQMNTVQVDENGNLVYDENGYVLCGLEDFQGKVEPQDRQQDTVNHEVWIALKKEEDTYGILMPKAPKYENENELIYDKNGIATNGVAVDSGHRPKACSSANDNDGDTFVILNINLPDEYIYKAEKKLEKSIVKYIWENNVEKFNFSVNFSRIFLEENPSILNALNENARLTRVKYNGDEYILYVSSYSYSMNEGDVLPEIRVELDDTLTISQNALQNAINEVKSDIASAINAIDVAAIGSRYFLRKDTYDVAEAPIEFKQGVVFGDNGMVEVNEDGTSKLTIDYLDVTRKATFTSLEIQDKSHVGGEILITPASMVCNRVEELEDAYRCYFETYGESGEEIFNQFSEGDQAISQTFNEWGGHYYWRLVTDIGEEYIDLSKTDCAPESDIPQAGDKIIQLGNRINTTRQAAQVLSSHGENAPSFIMYNGIDSFSLEGKEVTGIEWNAEKQEPEMYSYGSFYFGDKSKENNFVTFDKKAGEDKKSLRVRGSIAIEEGSIISSRMDVGNPETGEIEAFFNGGTFAEDTDVDPHTDVPCGKLIIAAGIPKDDRSLEERAKEASTRVYEDGCAFTNNMHLREGCIIGDDIFIQRYGEESSIIAKENDLDFTALNKNGLTVVQQTGYYTSAAINRGSYVYTALFTNGMRPGSPDSDKNIGIVVGAQDGYAIFGQKGMFAGLRPNIRVITNNSTYDEKIIKEYDHTIIINDWSGDVVEISLPDNPQEGQKYEIYITNAQTNLWIHFGLDNDTFNFITGADLTSPIKFQDKQRKHIEMFFCGQWWLSYRFLY